ncbi:DUF4765 family protein [Serratia proteamaculans]|uniref:DUF4765 family protein n=1 Tax=Serratia proteamaculans TaxID=28151 RepID=UPI001075E3F5|nr:DUF4765 family protein [Serratia proteamaculans]TFZ48691.1 DUF4765 family protein [Serratia proteamaculans]
MFIITHLKAHVFRNTKAAIKLVETNPSTRNIKLLQKLSGVTNTSVTLIKRPGDATKTNNIKAAQENKANPVIKKPTYVLNITKNHLRNNKETSPEKPHTFLNSPRKLKEHSTHPTSSINKTINKLPAYSQLDVTDDDYMNDIDDDGPLPKKLEGQYKALDYSLILDEVSKGLTPDKEYILYRGTSSAAVVNMLSNQSAGDKADINTPSPLESERKKQVSKGGFIPEFSTDISTFDGFSRGRYGVVVKIKQRYLAPGSHSESGLVVNRSAPIKILEVYDRTYGKPELSLPNAS